MMMIVFTPTRMYHFIGFGSFEGIIRENLPQPFFREIPCVSQDANETKGAKVSFFCHAGGAAQHFAWLTEIGVFYTNIVYRRQKAHESLTGKDAVLSYKVPSSEQDDGSLSGMGNLDAGFVKRPLDIVRTEFHYLLLYDRTLQCINSMSEEVVFEFRIHDSAGIVRGFAQDVSGGTIWVVCERRIYELVITDEDRDNWELYVEQKDWETAVRCCRGNKRKINCVYAKRAEDLFTGGSYELAAEYYARTNKPFEEVALSFIGKDKRKALKKYLSLKLDQVPQDATTQVMVIAT